MNDFITDADGRIQVRDPVNEDDLREAGLNVAAVLVNNAIGDLLRYPVLSEGGWFIVIKNQKTLKSISRRPWRLLGPIHLLSDDLEID